MTRILIVDDEPGIRQSISTLLQLEGYDLASAADGEAGLQKVLDWAPDVVISDLQMPKMDGLQLLAAIRALPALNHVRFIILAGLPDSDQDCNQTLSLADARITKPFTRGQLLNALRSFGV
jgi:CheY-like chemotaxis protein